MAYKPLTEISIAKEMIEYCERRIEETGLTQGYYHDMIRVFRDHILDIEENKLSTP